MIEVVGKDPRDGVLALSRRILRKKIALELTSRIEVDVFYQASLANHSDVFCVQGSHSLDFE